VTLKKLAKYWLPILLWALVIYSASGDRQSVNRSSRIIEPVVRWLVPEISAQNLWRTVLFVRKCAHVTEYAVFAMLLHRAVQGSFWSNRKKWSWYSAGLAWGIATAFAVTDEWHQLFVPGRQGSPWDVLLDSSGAAIGILLLYFTGRILFGRKSGQTQPKT